MLGRERRHERREERREARAGGPEVTRYQMRQRMISIGDDYVIENDRGERAFKLDGKALRVRACLSPSDLLLTADNDRRVIHGDQAPTWI